jgi:CelD/BcsL family acetyltransferase involved in cellulose biosynthesis
MELKRYNNFDALAKFKHNWNHLLEKSINQVPFLTYDYLETWWQTKGGGEWPEDSELVLIAAFEGEDLVGIAPLFRANNLDGIPALMFVGAIEVSDFLDFIVAPENLSDFLYELMCFLNENEHIPEWQVLDLYNILDSSPTLKALEEEANKCGAQFTKSKLLPSPYIPLPGDFEEYLAGIDKKQRHEIRRKLRKIAQGPAIAELYFADDGEKLESEMDAFIAMMAQDPAKKDFLTEKMKQHLQNTARIAYENGWLQLAFYTINGEKAAGNLSFNYNDRLWLYNSAWDWAFRDYSPGWLLLAELILWSNENGIKEFDFMRGGEDYKYKFGGIDRFIYRVTVKPG